MHDESPFKRMKNCSYCGYKILKNCCRELLGLCQCLSNCKLPMIPKLLKFANNFCTNRINDINMKNNISRFKILCEAIVKSTACFQFQATCAFSLCFKPPSLACAEWCGARALSCHLATANKTTHC